ncbi:TPA: hypothetical protein AB5F34_003172, partial [Vibrio mimicus]
SFGQTELILKIGLPRPSALGLGDNPFFISKIKFENLSTENQLSQSTSPTRRQRGRIGGSV